MIRSAVLIQSTHVTDGQTDGIAVACTRCGIYAVARNKDRYILFLQLLQTTAYRMLTLCRF